MQTPFLTAQLFQDLKQIKQASDLSLIIHHSPIKLALLQKKQLFFLTDGMVIIQGQVRSFSLRHKTPTPFNRIRSDYYNFNTKHANLFIFNQSDLQGADTPYPSAYNPRFHFQDRMDNFDSTQALNVFKNVTEVLQITQWGFGMVNIANSGYYGAVLDIFKYSRVREKYIIQDSIHSILYQKSLAEALEQFRIRDMKAEVGDLKRQPISLCFYRKNLKTTHVNKTLQSNFVTADRTGKVIKVNLLQKQHYLPLGKLSGVLRFLRPLTNFSESKKPPINFNFFREMPTKKKQRSDQSECGTSQSSSSEQQQPESEEDQIVVDQAGSSESSSEDEVEPLKMIYLKQLKAMNIQ